jgi:predicted acetyltransferase
VTWLSIIPFTIRVGAAAVRMDGIGGVGTDEACRNRGYSRRLLEAAVERMQQGDAALSMLYGIPNYYPKFGYAVAGPDHLLSLSRLEAAELPPGWRARPFAEEDTAAVYALYEMNTANAVGAAVRPRWVWDRLRATLEASSEDACRVAVSPDGQVAAYAWRGAKFWYVDKLAKETPDALVLAEVMAAGPEAADAVLALCRGWAREEGDRRPVPVKHVLLALPPEGPVAAAAMRQQARLVQAYEACGGSMARVLDVERLLTALLPELTVRVRAARWEATAALRVETDQGAAALRVYPSGVELGEAPDGRVLRLPQTALAQLALGAFPPADILARLRADSGADDDLSCRMVELLFPLRHPHMHLPDRY